MPDSANTPINLAPIVTFAIYVIISVYWKGSSLEVSQAFTSLTLISLLTAPFMLFTQILPVVIQTLACFDRVQEYCNYGVDTRNTESSDTKNQNSTADVREDSSSQDVAHEVIQLDSKSPRPDQCILFNDESFKWKVDGPLILKNIKINIRPATFTALVGPVGSGKSSLLESILGETIAQSPLLQKKRPISSAYCSQMPWLENKTIRDNIIGGNNYDDKRYETVRAACDLESDIECQAQGDMTRIGSKGVSLSGGQKQRIVSIRLVDRLEKH